MLKVGDKAPDMLGCDENGQEIRLSSYNGKKIVLYFYPKDNTPGCTAEACSLRDGLSDLADAGFVVIGVSKDSADSHKRFIEKQNLNFHLITDTEKKLIETFGVWGEKRMMGKVGMGVIRTTFVIGNDGVIERVIEKVDTKDAAHQILSQ